MTTEYTGAGDPRRTLELLWGRAPEPRRGPKQQLDVPTVVAAAIAIADETDLGAVSMRSVARRLGRSPMSLYTYVPSKAELLDLMLDSVMGELPAGPLDANELAQPWRTTIERWVDEQWALSERHPWLLSLSAARAALGPNSMAAYERLLTLLDGIGLTGLEMQRLAGALHTFVAGAARAAAEARQAPDVTGVSDDDWWTARAPLLAELSGAEEWADRFPVSGRLEAEGAFEQPERDPSDDTPYLEREALDAFHFGLGRLLDGVEALVGSRPTSAVTAEDGR